LNIDNISGINIVNDESFFSNLTPKNIKHSYLNQYQSEASTADGTDLYSLSSSDLTLKSSLKRRGSSSSDSTNCTTSVTIEELDQ